MAEYEQYDFDFADHNNHNSSDADDGNESDENNDDYDEDDNFAFAGLGSKRKRGRGQGYTTFENDPQRKKSSQERREESLYGVFAKSSFSPKWKKSDLSKEVAFVPAKTSPVERTTVERTDEMNKQDEKDNGINQEQPNDEAEAANLKFLALLNRGRGGNKHNRTQIETRDTDADINGDFKLSSSETNANNTESFQTNYEPKDEKPTNERNTDIPSMDEFFSSSSYSNNNTYGGNDSNIHSSLFKKKEKPKIDPNIGKWEKHTKGIGMKLLTKMGFSGSGGLGKRNRQKPQNQNHESNAYINGESVNHITNKSTGAGVGISKPVEVVVRPANLGLGYGNFKEASRLKSNRQIEAEVRGTTLDDDDEDDEDKQHKQSKQSKPLLPSTDSMLQSAIWKKSKKKENSARKGQRERKKFKFISYEEILKPSPTIRNEQGNGMKIIDMRGPEPTDPEALQKKQKNVLLGEEVLHNTTLLMNAYESRLMMAQNVLQSNLQKVKSVEQSIDHLERNIKDFELRKNRVIEIQQLIHKVELIVQNIDEKELSIDSSVHSFFDELNPLLSRIRAIFSPEECQSLHLNDIILPSLLNPAFDKYIKNWDPLQQPDFIANALQLWRPLLSGNEKSESEKANDTTHVLETKNQTELENINARSNANMFLFQQFVSISRKHLLSKWNVYESSASVTLYKVLLAAAKTCDEQNDANQSEDGLPNLSPSNSNSVMNLVKDLLLDTVLPKITGILREWTPSMQRMDDHDITAPHNFILPWLPYLSEAMRANLFSDIQRKLKSILTQHAGMNIQNNTIQGNRNAYKGIEASYFTIFPWKNILPLSIIHSLMSKHILPTLKHAMLELDIDPSNQNVSTMLLIQKFNDSNLFPSHTLASLIEGEFCLKWLNTMYSWLFGKNSNTNINEDVLEEVAQFYLGWKQMVLVDLSLINDEIIVRYFYAALKMIDAAIRMKKDVEDTDKDTLSDGQIIDKLEPPGSEVLNFDMILRKRKRGAQEKMQRKQDIEDQSETVKHKVFMERPKQVRHFTPNTTFRDVLEDYAIEHGILLVPRREGVDANARIDGKQVYNFGQIPIYLDENVVFASIGKDESKSESGRSFLWEPISLEDLVVACKRA